MAILEKILGSMGLERRKTAPAAMTLPSIRQAGLPRRWHNAATPESHTLAAVLRGVGLPVATIEGMGTVFACLQKVSDSMASIPLDLYRVSEDGRKRLPKHPLARLLKQPNKFMHGFDFRRAVIANVVLNGVGYVRLVRNQGGGYAELAPIPSHCVSQRVVDNTIQFQVSVGGKMEILDWEKMLVIRGGLTFDGLTTTGASVGAANAIALARSVMSQLQGFYEGGGSANYVVSTPAKITPELRAKFNEQWAARLMDLRSGEARPFLISESMKIDKLDSQQANATPDALKATNLEICRVFGVPPSMLGFESNNSDPEQEANNFIAQTLLPLAANLEESFGVLLDSSEWDTVQFDHDFDKLVRIDTAKQAESLAVLRINGLITANEARRKINLPAVPGGDVLLEPMNMKAAGDGATGTPGNPTTKMKTENRMAAFLGAGYLASIGDIPKDWKSRRAKAMQRCEAVAERWAWAQKFARKNAAAPNEYRIYGDIGEGFGDHSSIQVLSWLDSQKDVVIRINSRGGDPFEGIAILNALDAHASKGHKVEVFIDALAASAASIAMLGGTEISVASNAIVMIHRAWTIFAGNASDFAKEVENLNKIDSLLVESYAKKTGKEATEIMAALEAETWLNASEAIAWGLCDKITHAEPEPAPEPEQKPEPDRDTERLSATLARFKARFTSPQP